MRKLNLIVVFNKNLDKALFCIRAKEPYKGLYNFVGGKVEEGEEMDKYRQYDKFEHCSKCEIKNFCRGCPSVAKCLTGDFYSKDPQCWKKF